MECWHPCVARGCQRVILKIVAVIRKKNNARGNEKTDRTKYPIFFSFYIDHVTPLCFVIGKRANKKFQEPSAIDFWLLLFPTPSVSAILSPRIIRHRFDCTRTHTSIRAFLFPPPRGNKWLGKSYAF